MSPDEAILFRELFNHWASSSVQLKTKNGDYGDGSQHQFIAWLLSHRPAIIAAVEAQAGIAAVGQSPSK
jgi:hypothetical protein